MRGWRSFAWLSAGQTGAQLGVGLTAFAVAVHVLDGDGSTLSYGMISALGIVPSVVVAPAAGVLTDRWGATRALVIAGTCTALCSAALAALLAAGVTAPLPLGALLAAAAVCTALQWPAWVKASTALLPPEDLGRASGWMQLGQAAQHVGSPLIAAALLLRAEPWGVVACDAALALLSAVLATAVRIRPEAPVSAAAARFGRELAEGWRWIRERRPLWDFQWYFGASFGLGAFLMLLTRPLLLSMTGVAETGIALTAAGAGMVAGSVAAGLWRGPRRRAPVILWLDGTAAVWMLLTAAAPTGALVGITGFLFLVQFALVNSLHQALWQTKVPLAWQGRVFGVRRMVMWAGIPAGYFVAGALSEPFGVRAVLAAAAVAKSLSALGAARFTAVASADDAVPDAPALEEPAAGAVAG